MKKNLFSIVLTFVCCLVVMSVSVIVIGCKIRNSNNNDTESEDVLDNQQWNDNDKENDDHEGEGSVVASSVTPSFSQGAIKWVCKGNAQVGWRCDNGEFILIDNGIVLSDLTQMQIDNLQFRAIVDGVSTQYTLNQVIDLLSMDDELLTVYYYIKGEETPHCLSIFETDVNVFELNLESIQGLFRGWFYDIHGNESITNNSVSMSSNKVYALFYPCDYVKSVSMGDELYDYCTNLRKGDAFEPNEEICKFKLMLSDDSDRELLVDPSDVMGYSNEKLEQEISIPFECDRLNIAFTIKPELVIDHIQMISPPKTKMWLNESWSMDEQSGAIRVVYTEEGNDIVLPINEEMIDLSTYNPSSLEKQEIRVVYSGKSCTFDYCTRGLRPLSIEVLRNPRALSVVGEELLLDDSGIMRVTFADESTCDIEIKPEYLDFSSFDKTTAGEKILHFSYADSAFYEKFVSFCYYDIVDGWFMYNRENVFCIKPIDDNEGNVYYGGSFSALSPLLIGEYIRNGSVYTITLNSELKADIPAWIEDEWMIGDGRLTPRYEKEEFLELVYYSPASLSWGGKEYYRFYTVDDIEYVSYYRIDDLGWFINCTFDKNNPDSESPLYILAKLVDLEAGEYRMMAYGGYYMRYIISDQEFSVALCNSNGELVDTVDVFKEKSIVENDE